MSIFKLCLLIFGLFTISEPDPDVEQEHIGVGLEFHENQLAFILHFPPPFFKS